MLLQNKNAIIYGAAGPVGSAVTLAFAREGARVFLAGRTLATLDAVAEEIRSKGGTARTARVDALDRMAVDAHADEVAESAGGIDIAFNATANDDVQGTPLAELSYGDFMRPVTKAVSVQFLIGNAVGRHMAARGAGVILVMAGGREAIANLGGSHVAWSALSGLCRQQAAELGPGGVRVLWLLSPGSPDPAAPTADPDVANLLGRMPAYDDVANAATFLVSDWAPTMTATEVNLTGGVVVD